MSWVAEHEDYWEPIAAERAEKQPIDVDCRRGFPGGVRITNADDAPPKSQTIRHCAAVGCATQLSSYNLAEFCYLHTIPSTVALSTTDAARRRRRLR